MTTTLEMIMSELPPERQEHIKARAQQLIEDQPAPVDMENSTDSDVQKFEPAKPDKPVK